MKIIPDAALNQHIAILGKTGSGKSYAAKGIVEGLLKQHRQVCVVDPTSAWWGLRLDADGKSAGFDVVLLGGKRGDLPLSERSGAAVARLVTEQGASVVIDTSGMTVGEYTRWFIDFAGTLYTTIRDPLHLVIDEAHYFMPQGKAPDIDAGKMIHAGNRLMSGGRSLGIRGLLITQRPAKLHKDSLTCADTLIAMRVIAPQDRQAIKDWIDGAGDPVQGKAVLDSLAQLKRGEGWVWYPEGQHLERVTFPKIRTYDSSSTPTHGAKAGPKVAEIKLDEVKAALAEAVREAEANDPKLLRAEIVRLQRELRAVPKTEPAPAKVDQKAIERAVAAAQKATKGSLIPIVKGFRSTISVNAKTIDAIESMLRHVRADAESQERTLRALEDLLDAPTVWLPPAPAVLAQNANYKLVESKPRPIVHQNGHLPGPQSRILAALAWCKSIGNDQPKRTLVAAAARYRPTSTGFTNPLGALRAAGLLEYPDSETLRLTDEGMRKAPAVDSPPTLDEFHRGLIQILTGPEGRILGAVIHHGPKPIDRDSLAASAGYSVTSTGFTNPLGVLRSKGFIDYPNSKQVQASEALFPGGLN